jgi:hypothetical protein
MKANELRIGNYLMDDESDTLVVVSRIESIEYTNWNSGDEFNIVVLEYGTKERYLEGDFRPIPLTEEWLLKLGFSMDDEYLSMWINDYKYCFKYRDWAKNWAFYIEYTDSPHPKDENQKYPVSFDIRYVHQLQNLYFALTGYELEIKDEVY